MLETTASPLFSSCLLQKKIVWAGIFEFLRTDLLVVLLNIESPTFNGMTAI